MSKYKIAHELDKKWRSRDVQLKENVDFSALLLSKHVLDGLEKAGFKKPSPIQLEAIPLGKFGRDLIIQAKSGTGKTLVFVIVALELLKPKLFRPQVLVIVPTREIATQVCSVIKAVSSKFKKLICNSFIGGMPLADDESKAVMTQIAVGTPGRLKQLMQMKSLPTNSIRLLVFDEADELLSATCFKDDIEDIFKLLPDDKQVIATSATFQNKIRNMVNQFLSDAVMVHLNRKQLALLGMVHYFKIVDHCPIPLIVYKNKLDALEKILKTVRFAQCLLFCNGIQRVDILQKDVKKWGFSVAYMSGAREQVDRLKAIERLKRFKCKVLVSSNVTARGIDAENVDLVINFDLAHTTEIYMHRVGRAGRYGTVGTAISIVNDMEIPQLERIKKEGSFKTFKLPDPIPKDLILNVPESDVESSDIDEDNINENDCSSEKDSASESYNKLNDHETDVDIDDNNCKNISPESVTQFVTAESDNHDDITKPSAECKMKTKKMHEDDITDADAIHLKEQTDQYVQNENIQNSNIRLSKVENNVFIDIEENKLINRQSTDKSCACDIHKNSVVLSEVSDVKCNNTESGAQLVKTLSSATDIEKYNFGTDDEKLKEMHIDNISKINIVENKENEFVHCEQRKNFKSCHKLNNTIETFVAAYETSNTMKPIILNVTLDENCQENENPDKKFVTLDMINNLKSQKQEFLYKTFKTFLENENIVACKNEAEDEKEESSEDNTELIAEEENAVHPKFKENSECVEDNTELIAEEETAIDSDFKENSECREVFLNKPHFESTPQLSDKNGQKAFKITRNEALRSIDQNKLIPQFPELIGEPNIDSSESVEETSDDSGQNSYVDSKSNDSESLSSSSHSEEDSDSEENSSSDDSSTSNSSHDSESDSNSSYSDVSSSTATSSVNRGIHHHSSCRTGRQNPSLIPASRSEHICYDTNFYNRCSSCCNCACCAIGVGHKYFRSTIRFPQMIREVNGMHNYIHQDTSTGGNYSSYCGRMVMQPPYDFNSANIRHHHSANNFATQLHDQPTHSRGCRFRNSLNHQVRGGYQRGNCQVSRGSSRPHPTFNCYLPSSHRCHPNTPDYDCENGAVCDMWYQMFYNQWLHIQKAIN